MDLHAIQTYRDSDWYGADSRPVNISGDDMNIMSPLRQCLTKAMHRKDRPAVSHSRQVGWDDVEDAQWINSRP